MGANHSVWPPAASRVDSGDDPAADGAQWCYRRQWLAAPVPVSRSGWREHEVGPLFLATHPDLAIAVHHLDGGAIGLLGECLDPEQPGLGNAALAAEIAAAAHDADALEARLQGLGGRWVVIVASRLGVRVYPDATATRPIFYAVDAFKGWLAASPNLLNEHLDRPLSHERVAALDPTAFDPVPTRSDCWFGVRAPFSGMRRLLPNHFLDWRAARPVRFWPNGPLPPLDLDTSAEESFRLLRGTVDAVCARGRPVHAALTAGYDSRTILAASLHRARDEIVYYGLHDGDGSTSDLRVARILAAGCDRQFSELAVPPPRRRLITAFDRSTAGMIVGACRSNAHTYLSIPGDPLFIEGTVGELGRANYYRRMPHPHRLDGDRLGRVCGFRNNRMAVRACREWLAELPPALALRPLDLFFWEMRLGAWVAMNYTGQDLVRNVVSAFNNRQLLSTMLQAPERARQSPYQLHRAISARGLPVGGGCAYNDGWRDRLHDRLVHTAHRLLPDALAWGLRGLRHRRFIDPPPRFPKRDETSRHPAAHTG